jgi:hypothetical protein
MSGGKRSHAEEVKANSHALRGTLPEELAR